MSTSAKENVQNHAEPGKPELKRALGLWAVALFGIGDILGSGVYFTIRKIAGFAGTGAWMSYVLAGFVAALTGFTYAEYTSRFPKAGGAAHFTQSTFRAPLLTFMVIFFVGLSGLFSVAATSRTFAEYAMRFLPEAPSTIKDYILPLGFVLLVSAVTARGIMVSSAANAICSVVEVSALLLIIGLGISYVGGSNLFNIQPVAAADPDGKLAASAPLTLAMMGAAAAFFAFIGFEDMANLSEEVRDAERTVPLAICIAIAVTSVIYCLISLVAVSVVRPAELYASSTPLIEVVRTAAPNFPVQIFSVIPAFAVFNTGLLNMLMASRLLYGMSRGPESQLPRGLSYVHPRWQTPVIALGVAAVVAMAMIVATRDIARLAAGTTTFLLVVFSLLHLGLLKLKFLGGGEPKPRFQIPAIIPALGLLCCLALLGSQEMKSYIVAGWLTLAAVALFLINWFFLKRRVVEPVD